MAIVHIRNEATKEVRTYADDWDDASDYMWSEGNYACDCNRYLLFERAGGVEEANINDGVCGETAYAVRITDDSGKELYRDERW